MRCPSLKELPSPEGKIGWPWTEESFQLPDKMPDGSLWPTISIVTPSYNQGQFIEEAIRSVLLQGYPNVEYFIFDGASEDSSVAVIRKYEKWLTFWVSEKDHGQTHAINKGLSRSTGNVFNWLNSDDRFTQGAFAFVAERWMKSKPHFIIGEADFVDQDGKVVGHFPSKAFRNPIDFISDRGVDVSQPAAFVDRKLIEALGGSFAEHLNCVMDYEFYLRAVMKLRNKLVTYSMPRKLAYMVDHPDAKTSRIPDSFRDEWRQVLIKNFESLNSFYRVCLFFYFRRVEAQFNLGKTRTFASAIRLLCCYPEMIVCRFFWGFLRQMPWSKISK